MSEYDLTPGANLGSPVYEVVGKASWDSWHKTAMLIRHLTRRSLAARYRGSALGFVWSLVNPVLMMFVYTIVFRYFFQTDAPGVPFQVYVMTGILAWNFFSSAAINASVSLVSGAALVNKCAFPRIALPVSVVCASAINYLVALPLLIAFILISGVRPTATLFLLPCALLLLTLMATGLGALLAALMPFFMDLQHLIEVAFTMWFFLTPVVYPIKQVPKSAFSFYQMNPMVGIVQFIQSVFLGLPMPGTSLAIAVAGSLVTFVFGLWVFSRLSIHCTEV